MKHKINLCDNNMKHFMQDSKHNIGCEEGCSMILLAAEIMLRRPFVTICDSS